MSNTRYIRNRRPNRFNFRVPGLGPNGSDLKLGMERRGALGDTLAITEEVFSDYRFQRNLKAGHVEEISQEAFLNLAERDEDEPQRPIQRRTPVVKYDLPGENEKSKATQIEQFDKDWMTPTLDFVTPETTSAPKSKTSSSRKKASNA